MFSLPKRHAPAPAPFSPHATPPPGSAGDGFDEHLRLPRRPLPGEAEEWQLQKDQRLQRKVARHAPVTITPRMHPGIAAALACLAVGLASWGPLRPYGSGVAAFGGILAAIAAYRVKVSGAYATGARRGAVVCVLCFAWAAAMQLLPARLDRGIEAARRGLGASEARGPLAEHASAAVGMRIFAELSACAVKTLGQSIAIAKGITDHEGEAPSDERYVSVSTINASSVPVRAIFRDGNPHLRGMSDVPAEDIANPVDGLEDPYSEGGRFPYPVVVRDGYVVVWSKGPDRDADLSPMHDLRPGEPESERLMIESAYDPTNGAESSGDMIVWKRLEDVDCTLHR